MSAVHIVLGPSPCRSNDEWKCR